MDQYGLSGSTHVARSARLTTNTPHKVTQARVVDSGTSFKLEAIHPPEVVDGEIVRHGRSETVPSRFGEPDEGLATVVVAKREGALDETSMHALLDRETSEEADAPERLLSIPGPLVP